MLIEVMPMTKLYIIRMRYIPWSKPSPFCVDDHQIFILSQSFILNIPDSFDKTLVYQKVSSQYFIARDASSPDGRVFEESGGCSMHEAV